MSIKWSVILFDRRVSRSTSSIMNSRMRVKSDYGISQIMGYDLSIELSQGHDISMELQQVKLWDGSASVSVIPDPPRAPGGDQSGIQSQALIHIENPERGNLLLWHPGMELWK